MSEEDDDLWLELHFRVVRFANGLKESHGNYSDCELYHLLAGSTISPERRSRTFLDFKGEYSVKAFLEDLAKKFYKEELAGIKKEV